MVKIKPVIKWTGSKRGQSEEIISRIPKKIKTYYEPFIGGGSVMFQLLHSEIEVENIICSDLNNDLIQLWNTIKDNPQFLIDKYSLMWKEMKDLNDIDKRKAYFYSIREEFNETRSPELFLFLSRTCTNGLIRYNSSGNFNTSLHFSRDGITPDKLEVIINDWSKKLNERNVQFINQSYENIQSDEGDFIYLDPPYANTKGIYYGTLDYELFWNWIREQKGKYILSFDGKRADVDNTYDVPKDIYSEHTYLLSGRSSFKDLKQQVVEQVYESLYIK
ncbi:Dam family site-specific DNA-(adenine-N6)-methyltransferase [Butyricicoccus sp. 1XD8-22]|nr:Dam family site-specific DNA-(adenine-N6)-methyltransferase [Butyricicoccus sp. 1XD8-22]